MSVTPAVQIYAESVDRLRGEERVTPVERLRLETFALLDQIPPVRTAAEVDAALAALRSALERPLAVALALLDYGGERGSLEVGWMLQTLATELGEKDAEPTEPLQALALHDLAFSLLADCLARGRLEPLPRLAAVTIPSRFDRKAWPIFESVILRHPNAFERGADRAYSSWSEWLATSELTAALSHVRDPDSYKAAIAEAELIAALSFAQSHGAKSFCAIIGAEGPAERRLRQHLRDLRAASAVAELLGVDGFQLEETLNRLYSSLVGAGPFGASHGQLIASDREDQ